MKRILAALLCLALLLTVTPLPAAAEQGKITPVATRLTAEGEDGNSYVYCVYHAEEGYGADYFAALEYVAWNEGEDVTEISVPAYVPYEDALIPMRYISLPENSSFHYGSLSDRSGNLKNTLRRAEIPATVERICDRSFFNCSQLQTVVLHEGLKSIGKTAFFSASALEELELPTSLEALGESCCAGCSSLTSVNFEALTALREIPKDAFQNSGLLEAELPEGLRAVRYEAFRGAALRWVSFPSTLQTLEASCFEDCKSLRTVRFAEQTDPAFTTINGFAACSALREIQIPNTVKTIADGAFYQCGLTSVIIPDSVTLIGNKAFNGNRDLAELIFLPGSTPLTVGPLAFQYCTALSRSVVTLPQRVTELQEGCFSYIWSTEGACSPTYYICNPRLRLVDNEAYTQQNWEGGLPLVTGEDGRTAPDPWFRCVNAMQIFYPETMREATSPSFLGYMALCAQSTDGLAHPLFIPFDAAQPERCLVYGLAPMDAEVTVRSAGEPVELLRNGRWFAAWAAAELPVSVDVTREGFEPQRFAKDGAGFRDDWYVGELTSDSFTPLAVSGDLEIHVSGAADANLAVLDADGALVVSGKADGAFFLAADLPAGRYTVLGVGDNPYVSAFSSEAELLALGVQSYGKAENVAVANGERSVCELSVPSPELGAGVLKKAGLLLERQQLAPGTEFTLRINYQMTAGQHAERIDFVLPEGLRLLSVASQAQSYAADAYVTPAAADREAAVLSLRLLAEKTGNYTLSAAVCSGGTTVPLGSARCTVRDLILELPETFVQDRSVPVTVCAAPNTEVTLRAGTGESRKVFTDGRGLYRGVIELPEDTPGGMRTAIVASTDETAVHQSAVMAPMEARIGESYFIHAGQQIYGHRDGQNVSGGYYTYVANGDERNKYWTYSVTFEGSLLTDAVILNVYMMDGSVRHETMSLASVEAGETGWRQTYVCTVYLEQGGDHVFFPNLIPTGYDVTFTYMGRSFTVDADAVIYIRQLAAIDDAAWAQGVEDVIRENGLEPGDLDGIFDEGSVADEPWFDELPPDVQDAALQYEQAITDILDAMADLLGGEKDWADYDDADDFLEDLGIDHDENVPYDPEALADDGFTVTPPDADGDSWAFRDSPQDDGGSRYEYRDSSGTSLTVDARGNALNNAGMSAMGAMIGKGAEAGADWMLKRAGLTEQWLTQHPGATDRFGKLEKRGKAIGSVAGAIFGLIQADNDSNDYISAVEQYEKLKGELENARIYLDYYRSHNYSEACLKALENEIGAGEKLLELLRKQKNHALTDTLVGAGFTVAAVIAALPSAGSGFAAVETLNNVYDLVSNAVNLNRANKIVKGLADYINAMNQRFRSCGSLKKRGDCSFATRMDPSGVVYEAVESNLLSGVSATCYDVTNDTVWDGSPFGESNPQITGDEGFYAWDVPVGDWRVDFTKEGYEDASTEVVTVPPPQTGLKTGMIAQSGPELLSVQAFADYVEFVFSQYMDTALTVPDGYTAEWADPTPVCEGSETVYATILHLIPETAPQEGERVTLTLSGAKNYAGKPLDEFSGELTVLPRPALIELNYEREVAVLLNETPTPRLTARVLDANGDPMPGRSVSVTGFDPRFAEVTAVSATTDETGTATYEIRGLLPGLTELRLQVDDLGLVRTIPLRITAESNQVARPTATVGSTELSAGAPKDNYLTVPSGTLLTLNCRTESAVIYYTRNGACPCQDTENRIVYTEPIPLTESGNYRITAYKPGMEYSERLNLHVTVQSNPFTDVKEGQYYHEPVLWAVSHDPQITNGTGAATFSPEDTCTRGQVVTFLWRAKGCPEPTSTENPFKDVKTTDYFYKAVLWAREQEITNGTDATHFSPNDGCTRAQVVTFLWRAEGKPAPTSTENPFKDVPKNEYYTNAVLWAVEKKITNGTDPGKFSPNATCTRGQIVTFLYRDMA